MTNARASSPSARMEEREVGVSLDAVLGADGADRTDHRLEHVHLAEDRLVGDGVFRGGEGTEPQWKSGDSPDAVSAARAPR